MTSALRPIDFEERISALDILRGLALLGMILVHFHMRSLEASASGLDEGIRTLIWRLGESKSHGAFALLFGASFALQLRRAQARGAPYAITCIRRLVVLALFGFAAHALFGFNVLLGYAIWGVPLLLIGRWSTRALIVTAVLSVLSMVLFAMVSQLWELAALGREGAEATYQAQRANAVAVNSTLRAAAEQPEYANLVAARLRHMQWFYSQPFFFLPGAGFALFIAGLLAARHRLFEQPRAHKRLIVGMMVFGLVSWFAANWLPPGFWLLGLLRDQWLTFTYVGGALMLWSCFPRCIRWLQPIGLAGRMALTNYLIQIAVLDVLFAAYGLHVPAMRPVFVPLAAGLLFSVEVALSSLWLGRFRLGPAEWLWRSLTYGRAMPLVGPSSPCHVTTTRCMESDDALSMPGPAGELTAPRSHGRLPRGGCPAAAPPSP